MLDYMFTVALLLLPWPGHSGGVVIEEGFNLHRALRGGGGGRSGSVFMYVCVCVCMRGLLV